MIIKVHPTLGKSLFLLLNLSWFGSIEGHFGGLGCPSVKSRLISLDKLIYRYSYQFSCNCGEKSKQKKMYWWLHLVRRLRLEGVTITIRRLPLASISTCHYYPSSTNTRQARTSPQELPPPEEWTSSQRISF